MSSASTLTAPTQPAAKSSPRRLLDRARHALPHFGRDEAGVAALEFAFLAPVMLVMLLGTVEVSRGISLDRRFSLATARVSDLVTREKTLGVTPTHTLYGITKSAQTIMAPFDSTTLKLKVMSIMAIKADTTQGTVKWAYDCTASGCSASASAATCNPYTLRAGLVSQGASVIIVESEYTFSPLFTSWAENPFKKAGQTVIPAWKDAATNTPRAAICVDNGTGCTAPPACPAG